MKREKYKTKEEFEIELAKSVVIHVECRKIYEYNDERHCIYLHDKCKLDFNNEELEGEKEYWSLTEGLGWGVNRLDHDNTGITLEKIIGWYDLPKEGIVAPTSANYGVLGIMFPNLKERLCLSYAGGYRLYKTLKKPIVVTFFGATEDDSGGECNYMTVVFSKKLSNNFRKKLYKRDKMKEIVFIGDTDKESVLLTIYDSKEKKINNKHSLVKEINFAIIL